MTDLRELLDVTREAASAAAAVALAWQAEPAALDVEEKAASDDLVSQADRDAEAAARAVLRRLRPADAIFGEEGGGDAGVGEYRWSIDPIDGTTNYLYGRPDWAVSVAAIRVVDDVIVTGVVIEPVIGRMTEAVLGGGTTSDGRSCRCTRLADLSRALVEVNVGRPDQRPLAGSMVDALVGRVRDVRRGGSAAVALAQVATGRAEAYWGPGLQEWDGAAGLLIASESGACVGDLHGPSGGAWPASGDVLASAPEVWESLRVLLADLYT
ncbi:MAG: hypothetical protein JWM98_220 [Thermoleophilia bacterium]|nr:hypothetical protein [Thermoleophilia bacterium]